MQMTQTSLCANSTDLNNWPQVLKDNIYAYTLFRAVSNQRLFNIVGVNKKGEPLVCIESDMQFDDAAERVEELNKQLGFQEVSSN